MRCSAKAGRLLLALLLFNLAPLSAPPAFRSGYTFGEADGVYLLSPTGGAPPPPSLDLPTFRQKAVRKGTVWEVTLHSRSARVEGGYSWDARKADRLLAQLSKEFSGEALASLAPLKTADDACYQIAKLLRDHLAYAPRPGEEALPLEVFLNERRASCTGFARLAALLLQCGGVECEPVVGLRGPTGTAPLPLEGGALHVWLHITAPGGRTTNYDPVFSAGWLPARYVVLRIGGGFGTGALGAWKGATLRRGWQRDRLFAVPAREGETLFWRGGNPPLSQNRAMLCGKLLDGGDAPLHGTAVLSGADLSLTVPLWEGNFCFQDLLPGEYELSVMSGNIPCAREAVSLAPLDKKTVVFYSQGARRPSAVNGTGR